MREFESILETFSLEGWSIFSESEDQATWANMGLAEQYLKKYWLSSQEYEQKWKAIEATVFVDSSRGLPGMLFRPEFHFIATLGGCLFTREEFASLQRCLCQMGERTLVIVENTFGGLVKEPVFRMKFPANISWDEINSGAFASSILLKSPAKEYFLFSESAKWGRYAATDSEMPMNIYGARDEAEVIFEAEFGREIKNESVRAAIPDCYRKRMLGNPR